VFLDETGTPPTWRGATATASRSGASSRPCRMATGAPRGAWRALQQSGIVAPLVLDGPMTGPAFRAYVEQLLAPAIAAGDVVVLDTLAATQASALT
jgi:hypothetical protein